MNPITKVILAVFALPISLALVALVVFAVILAFGRMVHWLKKKRKER